MSTPYDTIGINYADLRKPDARIGRTIWRALGNARSVLNVGAGAGSYEPTDCQVTAIEPSQKMIDQRTPSEAKVLQGYAEDLPFDDNSFDASMAVLTLHHWTDKAKGLNEMRRVTRGPLVVLTFDPSNRDCWLTDYLPELVALDEKIMPDMAMYETWLGPVTIKPVPVPHDCTDGFLYAYWRRPAAYLDTKVTKAMSSFWAIARVDEALAQLRNDLQSGAWFEKYGDLADRTELDVGYRLVVSEQSGRAD